MGEAKNIEAVEAFIRRWQGREGGQERANYALFLTELCDMLGLPQPDPADATHERNDYVFERAVTRHRDEGDSHRPHRSLQESSFVLEAKQSRWKGAQESRRPERPVHRRSAEQHERGRRGARRAWDVLMLNAKRQAEDYARALPTSHGWPPFILVCDVGHCIEVYADFSGQGKELHAVSRPAELSHLSRRPAQGRGARAAAAHLARSAYRSIRREQPAKVTREIAERLAASVEGAGERRTIRPRTSRMFLMRCLFTMFAEDVKLLPENSFRDLLDDCREEPGKLRPAAAAALGGDEHAATSPHAIRSQGAALQRRPVRGLRKALPLGREEIGELLRGRAARTGTRSSRRSSARCWNRRSIRTSGSGSARTTRRAPMSSGWWSPPSSSRCARTGATCRPRPKPSAPPAIARAPRPRSRRSTTSCARRACSTRPAAPATSSTSRWN